MAFYEYVDDDRPVTLRRSGFLAVRDSDVAARIDLDIEIHLSDIIRAALLRLAVEEDGASIRPAAGLKITKRKLEAVSQAEEGISEDQDH